MFKHVLSALALASHGLAYNQSCHYEPRMIFYEEENPKLNQVPVKPDMNVTFELPKTSKPLMKAMIDMRTRLQTAQKYYDSTLPKSVVDAKVNVIMRLLFQDGQDILNFLYNTPDEPCLPEQGASSDHAILIFNSSVTINYLSVPEMIPEEIHETTYNDKLPVEHNSTSHNYESIYDTPGYKEFENFLTASSPYQGESYAASSPDSDYKNDNVKEYPTATSSATYVPNVYKEKDSTSVKKNLDYGVFPQHTPYAIAEKPDYDDYPQYAHYESPEKPVYKDDDYLEDRFW